MIRMLWLLPTWCIAHRGLLTKPSCDLDFGSSSEALVVEDPTISWSFKHYADCSRSAIWMRFTNPRKNFAFYVGVGIPTLDRFAALRGDALIIGPGLPELSEVELSSLPSSVRDDPAVTAGIGGLIHRSPNDQSSCAHLGPTMARCM